MKIFILVGPSGSGKDTLGKVFTETGIPELISHTTRTIRDGEVDGVDYNFVTKEEIEEIEMIERSVYSGNIYGISKKEIDSKTSKHGNVFIITDINGMKQIEEIYKERVVPIFISVTLSQMIARMILRGDKEKDVLDRISHCIDNRELENIHKLKYVIINDDLQKAKEDLLLIIKKETDVEMCISIKNQPLAI